MPTLIVDATANARAAGACVDLLCDRVKVLCATGETVALAPGDFAEVDNAAGALEAAILRLFDRLAPGVAAHAETVADLARARTVNAFALTPSPSLPLLTGQHA